MFRIVPKEEAAFRENFKRHAWQFIQDEGLNFRVATKMAEQEIDSLACELWYIKKMVKPEENDLLNTKENREKWEKEIAEAKAKGTMTYSCACGLTTNNEKEFDKHDCKFRKKMRRSMKK